MTPQCPLKDSALFLVGITEILKILEKLYCQYPYSIIIDVTDEVCDTLISAQRVRY